MSRFYNGFFKVHRPIYNPDNQKNIYSDRPIERDIFVWLIGNANYLDGKTPLKGQKVIVKRGQIVTSLSEISTRCARGVQQVRSSLNWLIATSQITSQSTNHGTIITILDYDKFQATEDDDNKPNNKPDNKPITNQQQTNNKPITNQQQTNNNILKNIRIKETKKERKEEVKKKNTAPAVPIPDEIISIAQTWANHVHSITERDEVLTRVSDFSKGIQAIIRIGKMSADQVNAMLNWIIKDEFWTDKCLSPSQMVKKRDGKRKLDSVLAAMKRDFKKTQGYSEFVNSNGDIQLPF